MMWRVQRIAGKQFPPRMLIKRPKFPGIYSLTAELTVAKRVEKPTPQRAFIASFFSIIIILNERIHTAGCRPIYFCVDGK